MPARSEPCDRRLAPAIGRHARLELVFGCRRGRTVLEHAYAEPPFRIGHCFSDGPDLHMIMASSAPGVFGGDCLQQVIRVGRGARVRLTSQSALQVHPTPGGAIARISNAYHIEANARLHCQWDPLIPFADARLDQQFEMHVAHTGCLYWSDALMAGRHACGERWRFAALRHELKVFWAGSLEYLERYCIDGQGAQVTRGWTAGDASYLGTAFALGPEFEEEVAERLHADLTAIPDVRAAVDRLEHRMVLVRLMGRTGPPFHRARSRIARALAPEPPRTRSGGPLQRIESPEKIADEVPTGER